MVIKKIIIKKEHIRRLGAGGQGGDGDICSSVNNNNNKEPKYLEL